MPDHVWRGGAVDPHRGALGAVVPHAKTDSGLPAGDRGWINGGFFVLSPQVINYIEGDGTVWEREPLERLAQAGQLAAFKHDDFWHPMDTLRDKIYLEGLWASGKVAWKVWE